MGKGASMVKQSEKEKMSGFLKYFPLLDAQENVMDHSYMVSR